MIYDIDKNPIGVDAYTKDEIDEKLTTGEPLPTETPKLYWEGTLPTTKDEGALKGILTYKSSTLTTTWYATLKVQGDSSAAYAKKNFTITLYTDNTYNKKLKVKFKDWKKTNSYVMKAHWIDHSHIRNISCAQIWEEIMESRDDFSSLPEELQSADGHGATKGFSFRFWANGLYYGLYEMILVKKSIFGQDKDNENHSLLNSDWNNKTECSFDTLTPVLTDGWTEELQDAVPATAEESFCNLIKLIAGDDDEEILANIDTYLDVQSVIDYDIFARVFCVVDNLAKNQIFATYDGTKWYEGAWDLDATCGNPPTPSESFFKYNTVFQDGYEAAKDFSLYNKLYQKIESLYLDKFKERYNSLRSTVLDKNNIISIFENNNDRVSEWLTEDYASTTGPGTFTTIPHTSENTIQQIRTFINNRLNYMDNVIDLMGQKTATPTYTFTYDKVNLSCATSSSTIYYTLDGTTPSSTNGTVYTEEFEASSGDVLNAIAISSTLPDSEILTETLVPQYYQVTSVTENGYSGFLTDYIPTADTEIEYKIKFDNTNITSFNWGRHFLSVASGGAEATGSAINNFYCPIFRTRGKTDGSIEVFAMTGGTTEYTYTYSSYDFSEPYTIAIKDNKITINNEDIFTDITVIAGTKAFAMFSISDAGKIASTDNKMSNAEFYYLTITENDEIVRQFIPVYDTINQIFGIYETKNNTFNTGANGFTGTVPTI